MKNIIKTALFLAVVAVGTSGIAWAAPLSVKTKNVIGKVESQSGSSWNAVKEGESIPVGTTLRTGPASSAVLVWAGGNTAKIGPLTNLKISAADKDASGKEISTIDLKSGKVVAHAKKLPTKDSTFSIKTPSAVAGVRGTDPFAEVSDDGSASFGVAAGSIEIETKDNSVLLDEGYYVEIDISGAFSEPEVIPEAIMEDVKEDLKEVNEEAKQAEAEAGGTSESAPAEEKKESVSSGGEKEDAAKEESAPAEEETSVDDASIAVDNALETEINAGISDTAEAAGEEALINGSVDIIIDLNTR